MARHTIPDTIERSAAPPAASRPLAVSLVTSLRPYQWTKNLIIFAALLFGQRLLDGRALLYASAAFAIFCALSGVVYLINDIADREADRQHPVKKHRPIASGALPVSVALTVALLLMVSALTGAFFLRPLFGVLASAYLGLLVLYSGPLKHIVIIDVLTIAIGFVLRAVAGAVAVDVEISHWLLVCTILLALFISLAKRRHELVLLAAGAREHRPILHEYSPYLLDQMIAITAGASLIAYILYTISPENAERFGTPWLDLTIPFPIYGIFRYLYLVHQRDGGGSPADLLLTDYPLLACVISWVLAVVLIVYFLK